MAHEVFISYSHNDKPMADAICATLEKDGCRCWYAPRDILPGADWAASIMDAIEHSKALIVVYTDGAIRSPQVLREINNAVRCGAVIIPFRLTRSEPSAGMLYYLSGTHWLDAVDGAEQENLKRLSELTRAVIPEGTRAAADPDPAKRFPVPVLIRVFLKAVIAFLLLLILGTDSMPAEVAMLILMLVCSLLDLYAGLPLKGRNAVPLRIICSSIGIFCALATFYLYAYNNVDNAFIVFMSGGFMFLWRLMMLICTCEERRWTKRSWPIWADSAFLAGAAMICISLLAE